MRFQIAAVILAVLALAIPYWPLAVLAILLAAAGGQWPLSIGLGLMFDVIYGRPPGGWLHAAAFPMTALALFAALVQRVIVRYLRRGGQEYL